MKHTELGNRNTLAMSERKGEHRSGMRWKGKKLKTIRSQSVRVRWSKRPVIILLKYILSHFINAVLHFSSSYKCDFIQPTIFVWRRQQNGHDNNVEWKQIAHKQSWASALLPHIKLSLSCAAIVVIDRRTVIPKFFLHTKQFTSCEQFCMRTFIVIPSIRWLCAATLHYCYSCTQTTWQWVCLFIRYTVH